MLQHKEKHMLKEGSTAVQQWGYRHCVSHVWNSSYFYCFQREKQSDKVPCGKQRDSLHSDKQQKVLCCQWVAHTNAERIFLWKEETIQMHITLCISLVTNPCCPGLWRQFWHSIKSLLLLFFFFSLSLWVKVPKTEEEDLLKGMSKRFPKMLL